MLEICAPAGNLPSFKAAINQGADAVFLGFNNDTNLRNFPGLNFTTEEIAKAVKIAHRKKKKVYITVNSYPQKDELEQAHKSIDIACDLGADALIISDIGLVSYTYKNHPDMRIHMSVQAGISNSKSIAFLGDYFNVKRVVLPRVFSLKEIQKIKNETDIELEVFGFGLLCINYEGRCFLSSYLTGESINTYGACAGPKFVDFQENEKLRVVLGGTCINEYPKGSSVAYPTPCKGHYRNMTTNKLGYAFQDPQSLNVLEILPSIIDTGVTSVKIEGRQRSQVYVKKAVGYYRKAIDMYYKKPDSYKVPEVWQTELAKLFEGLSFTCGCYVEK
jgi:collagenase-like PrtC family protease